MTLNLQNVQVQHCTVIEPLGLNIRKEPDIASAIVEAVAEGTVLDFLAVVYGEEHSGNAHWGVRPEGGFFWMGGTSRPNG